MFAGFDYGTSNCSIGVWQNGAVRLLPVEGRNSLIASTLYAPKPDLELNHRDDVLDMSTQSFDALKFGNDALQAYLRDPTQGYFVKSPKSFLGAKGLNERIKDRFISVVAAMMGNVKRNAESHLDQAIDQVIIGRPVNFQGTGGAAENQQALQMLVAAAHEAGFADVAFLFEPMAAAMEYEASLESEEKILVVDIGGGTTDCSFVLIGPSRREVKNRDADILGHAGERQGGNDYDQALALHSVMPTFGFGDHLKSGLPIPNTYFVDAVSTNDVNAQQRYFSRTTGERLDVFVREGVHPRRIARLARLREVRSTYRLLNEVERAKVNLSEHETAAVGLGFLNEAVEVVCDRKGFGRSTTRLLDRLSDLISETLKQGQTRPDVVYLTGGMAGAPVVRQHLEKVFGRLPLTDSDHFGSVTTGLTIWARNQFT
ncbi:MAG: molecular chaperone [Proteobacteria bacterium]|nr:molecular chaperone [Pseudomonadota bacterium]